MRSSIEIKTSRLYVNSDIDLCAPLAILDPRIEHYLLHVLRLKQFSHIRVFNHYSGEYLCEVRIEKKKLWLLPMKKLRDYLKTPDLCVYIGLLKPHAMHLAIEYATSLGATKIVPVQFNRSQIYKIKYEKYWEHAILAAEQSERIDIPILDRLISFDSLIEEIELKQCYLLIASEHADKENTVRKKYNRFIVGPEGGLTESEVSRISSSKYIDQCSLGPNILKAEVAMVKLISIGTECIS